MERLTKRIGKTVGIGETLRYYNYGDIKGILERLADIEDILGDEYDLDRLRELMNQRMTMRDDVAERMKLVGGIPMDRLRELVEADKDGRCVVFQPGPSVVSQYYQEDGLYIREAVGTVKKEEYESALGETLSSVSQKARELYYDILTGNKLKGEQHGK